MMGGVFLTKVSRLSFPQLLIAKSKEPALSLALSVRAASGCQTISSLAPVARLLLPSFLARAPVRSSLYSAATTEYTRGELELKTADSFALCAAKFSNKDPVTSSFGFLVERDDRMSEGARSNYRT